MKTKSIILATIIAMATMNGNAFAADNNSVMATQKMEVSPVEAQVATETPSGTNGSLLVNVEHNDRVRSNSTDVYKRTLYAKESVYIYVSGDGDTDLDLYIYDENGNLIDSDTDSGDTCLCSFTPKWTGTFTIKVKNLGSVYNDYKLRIVQ